MASDHHDDGMLGDIEQNISPDHAPSTIAVTTSPEAASASTEFVATDSSSSSTSTKPVILDVILYVSLPLYFSLYHIFIRPYLWFRDRRHSQSSQRDRRTVGIYSKLFQSKLTTTFVIQNLTLDIAFYLGCLLLLWLAISLHLPDLKSATFLGLIHWKWSMLAVLLVLGYPFVYICVIGYGELVADKLMSESGRYYAGCLFDSIVSLLYVLFIFLVWMFYFHQHQGLATSWPGVDKYTTRTLAMVLFGAFLWVVKGVVLLRKKTKAVYQRFKNRVLMAAFRLFFLNLILEEQEIPKLLPWKYKRRDGQWVDISAPEPPEEEDDENEVDNMTTSIAFTTTFKQNIQDRIKLSPHVSLLTLKTLTQALINLAGHPSDKEEGEDKQISDILHVYRRTRGLGKNVTSEKIKKLMSPEYAKLLREELKAEYPSKKIHEVPFENWVVDAHKSCVALGHTLVDVFSMLRVLDIILSWCVIVSVSLLWLLVTELATTTVLVVIGSPFLAFTFVLGDTCKNFFQGFIFAFVTRPFDIGDRCIIDGVEVEVRHINIMTTTCLKVGTKEKIVSPNSDLATKHIINLEGKLDPTDSIEVVLQPSTKVDTIKNLQGDIIRYVGESTEFFEQSCRVVPEEIRGGIKIITYFQHTVDGKDVSYSQFLEKKETQRSNLFMQIKLFIEKLEVQTAASN